MIQASPSPLTNAKSTTNRAAYLAQLLSLRADLATQANSADLHIWLTELRDRAATRIKDLAIPSTRDEEWRFTDLSDLLEISFQTAIAPPATEPTAIEPFLLPETADSRLVFVNGSYTPHLSATAKLPSGVFVGNLAQLPAQYRDRVQQYLAQQQSLEEVFTTLNTASLGDVAVVWVAKNQVVELPIQLLFVATGEDAVLAQPRCLVVAEPNSQVTLVEEYATGEGCYFTNAVTEIWVEANAEVRHTRIQRDSTSAFHIGKTAVSQARSARYTCNAISLGAKLSRHHLEVFQTGEQTELTINGLTMISGEQVADTHSAIAYTKPYGTSRQLQKNIVGDRAHAIFNGKVFVPQAAQLTDAGQLNRNLLISPKARVDTKPQLEIVADNVKCTHGATVGQLDADELFYLQSRGIDTETARRLLVYAFAYDILDQLPLDSLKQTLAQLVSDKIS
jgi:Fe-S cluster assembly protein SufD